jgi:hypothetical protein
MGGKIQRVSGEVWIEFPLVGHLQGIGTSPNITEAAIRGLMREVHVDWTALAFHAWAASPHRALGELFDPANPSQYPNNAVISYDDQHNKWRVGVLEVSVARHRLRARIAIPLVSAGMIPIIQDGWAGAAKETLLAEIVDAVDAVAFAEKMHMSPSKAKTEVSEALRALEQAVETVNSSAKRGYVPSHVAEALRKAGSIIRGYSNEHKPGKGEPEHPF